MAESESEPGFGIPVYGVPPVSASTSSGSSAAYTSREVSPSQEANEAHTARYSEGFLVPHSVANSAAGSVSTCSCHVNVQPHDRSSVGAQRATLCKHNLIA